MSDEHKAKGKELLEKGKQAEQLVHRLTENAFLADWCYLNPLLPNGRELCDVLVVYESSAIIWQIKHVKPDRRTGTHKESDFQKNARQLAGARRRLLSLHDGLIVHDKIQREKKIHPAELKKIHLVSAFWGNEEEYYRPFIDDEHSIHVLDQEGIKVLLATLNTINDFLEYLKAREKFFGKFNSAVLSGEQDLLAHFLFDRQFSGIPEADACYLPEGAWTSFINSPQYARYIEKNKITESWDYIIERSRECSDEKIIEELARPNRFQRRKLSIAFLDGMTIAAQDKKHKHFRRWVLLNDLGRSFCFLFDSQTDQKKREAILTRLCLAILVKFPNNKRAVGIATEKIPTQRCSYTFAIVDNRCASEHDKKSIQNMSKELGILENPIRRHLKEDEF